MTHAQTTIRRTATAILAACLLTATAAHTTAQEAVSGSDVSDQIKKIAAAKNIAQAASLYAEARAINEDEPELYRAYMRKALLLGYPRIAFYPATELIRFEPKNPMAMSTLGYYHALRGNYMLATPCLITAAGQLPADKSVLFNMGHLVAWYDHMPLTPNLPDPVKQDIGRNRRNWLGTADFKAAFNTSAPPLKKRTERINKFKEQADAHEETSASLTSLAKRLQVAFRNNAAGIAACQRGQFNTQDEKDKLQFDTSVTGYKRLARQRLLDRQMAAFRKREGELNQERGKITAKLDQTLKELGSARTALDEARENLRDEESQMPEMKWRPPTVDGRIIADAEPDGKPTIVVSKTAAAPSTGTDPAVALKLAKMLIDNGRADKARENLQELIAENPGTEVAKQAKDLLDSIAEDGDPTEEPVKPAPGYITSDPGPTTDTAPAPRTTRDPEDALKMARALIRNRQHRQAVLILRSILIDHPDSPAAEEAKILLKGLE